MSTQFSFRHNICGICDRYDELKIGRSGKFFIFFGYRNDPEQPTIISYDDWLDFFNNNDGKIFNEYGEELSVEKFCSIVNELKNKSDSYYLEVMNSPNDRKWALEHCWLDKDNNTFTDL